MCVLNVSCVILLSKVRLTRQDIEQGRLDSAERRLGKEDGGLASHSIKCESEIDSEKSKIVAMETGYVQTKESKRKN